MGVLWLMRVLCVRAVPDLRQPGLGDEEEYVRYQSLTHQMGWVSRHDVARCFCAHAQPRTSTMEKPISLRASRVCSSASSARKYRPHARQMATKMSSRYPAMYTLTWYMNPMVDRGRGSRRLLAGCCDTLARSTMRGITNYSYVTVRVASDMRKLGHRAAT